MRREAPISGEPARNALTAAKNEPTCSPMLFGSAASKAAASPSAGFCSIVIRDQRDVDGEEHQCLLRALQVLFARETHPRQRAFALCKVEGGHTLFVSS